MDSRPSDEMLLLAVAERDGDHHTASGTSVFDPHRVLGFVLAATVVVMSVLDVIIRPGALPTGMSRRRGA
jgi:hypothetical protein